MKHAPRGKEATPKSTSVWTACAVVIDKDALIDPEPINIVIKSVHLVDYFLTIRASIS